MTTQLVKTIEKCIIWMGRVPTTFYWFLKTNTKMGETTMAQTWVKIDAQWANPDGHTASKTTTTMRKIRHTNLLHTFNMLKTVGFLFIFYFIIIISFFFFFFSWVLLKFAILNYMFEWPTRTCTLCHEVLSIPLKFQMSSTFSGWTFAATSTCSSAKQNGVKKSALEKLN